jgi:hypothetical protein
LLCLASVYVVGANPSIAVREHSTMIQMTCYLAERCLQEYSMLRFLPSTIAAAVVMVARKSLRRHPWVRRNMAQLSFD